MDEFNKIFTDAPTHGSVFRGRRVIDAMPVELLRDQRGVYGIGVAEACDVAAMARVCGAEQVYEVPRPLILRRDCLEQLPRRQLRTAALQKIFGGLRYGVFRCTSEEALRRVIHHEALNRAGLSWPAQRYDDEDPGFRWWSSDTAQQVDNRRKYHGLRLLSVSVINRLIGQLIEEAADQNAIRAARRFAISYREFIYRAATSHLHILQLAETFPLAALVTCADIDDGSGKPITGRKHEEWPADLEARSVKALKLAKRGARLREVAAALEIPMAFRRVKPGVVHLVTPFLVQHPELLQWMPNDTSAARIWLKMMGDARYVDVDFAHWVARHVSQIPGPILQVGHTISDLWDWVRANTRGSGQQFATRRFTPSMALTTAIHESYEWHKAAAGHLSDVGDRALPPPWYPPAMQGGFDIVPLTTSADLYREGYAMHHCVGTYIDQVLQGTSYIFSVRCEGKRIATISLIRIGERVSIQQLRGPCNAEATEGGDFRSQAMAARTADDSCDDPAEIQ